METLSFQPLADGGLAVRRVLSNPGPAPVSVAEAVVGRRDGRGAEPIDVDPELLDDDPW